MEIENRMVVDSQWNHFSNIPVETIELAGGVDFFGNELLEGDEIVIDKQNFGEIILREHLKQYLVERCDFEFFNIRGMSVALDKFNFKVFAEDDLQQVLQEEYGFEFTQAQ
jgi:hypothetical protein